MLTATCKLVTHRRFASDHLFKTRARNLALACVDPSADEEVELVAHAAPSLSLAGQAQIASLGNAAGTARLSWHGKLETHPSPLSSCAYLSRQGLTPLIKAMPTSFSSDPTSQSGAQTLLVQALRAHMLIVGRSTWEKNAAPRCFSVVVSARCLFVCSAGWLVGGGGEWAGLLVRTYCVIVFLSSGLCVRSYDCSLSFCRLGWLFDCLLVCAL